MSWQNKRKQIHWFQKEFQKMAFQWKFNEVGTYIETENEKYAEIISMVERRRAAEKYLKIQKVREEKTVGVRLTRTFFIYKRGNDFGYKKFVLVELVPPPKLYLRVKEFYTIYVGTRFRLPDFMKKILWKCGRVLASQ